MDFCVIVDVSVFGMFVCGLCVLFECVMNLGDGVIVVIWCNEYDEVCYI